MKVRFTFKNKKGKKIERTVETPTYTLAQYIHSGDLRNEISNLITLFPDYYIKKIEDID